MGEQLKKWMIIRNAGIIIMLLTACTGFWFLATDFNNTVIEETLFWRLFGVIILIVVAYAPYLLLHKYVNKFNFLEVISVISIMFFIMNIYFLGDAVFNSGNSLGVFGILLYELLFIFVVLVFILVDKFFVTYVISEKSI